MVRIFILLTLFAPKSLLALANLLVANGKSTRIFIAIFAVEACFVNRRRNGALTHF